MTAYDLYRITMRQCSSCEHWGKVLAVYGPCNAPMVELDGVVESNCFVENRPHRGSHSCGKWKRRV